MCGRIALFTPPAHLARFIEAALAAGLDPEGWPSWNVGPQQHLFAATELDESLVLDRYRWGLVPSWAKDPAIANKLFNARAETVAEKPSFRSAFAKRPCVIPVDGFYEWDHRTGANRQPHFFTRRDGEPVLFAGLYEYWRAPDAASDAVATRTCTIITTEPSADMDELHHRMPVVLERDDVDRWLDVRDGDDGAPVRQSLLCPAPTGTLEHVAVGRAVGSMKNDGPDLITPLGSSSLF